MGDDKDATITPIFTKDEGLVLSGEYRQHFKDGEFAIAGSITEAQRNEGDPNNAIVRDDRDHPVQSHYSDRLHCVALR